eukprot:5668030-Amphidinium_carterae.1
MADTDAVHMTAVSRKGNWIAPCSLGANVSVVATSPIVGSSSRTVHMHRCRITIRLWIPSTTLIPSCTTSTQDEQTLAFDN